MSHVDDSTKLVTRRTLTVTIVSFVIGVVATATLWSVYVIPDMAPEQHQLERAEPLHEPCEGQLCALQRMAEAPVNSYREKKARGKLIAITTFEVSRFIILFIATLPIAVAGGFGGSVIGAGGHVTYRFMRRRHTT